MKSKERAAGARCRHLLAALALALLATVLLAAAAPAFGAAPGRPKGRAPKGNITQVKPTFAWTKAARAKKYEVRVYKGRTQVLRKTGLAKLSWKSSKALPRDAALTWKVRGSSGRKTGAWSRTLKFKIVKPQVVGALLGGWTYEGSVLVDHYTFRADGSYTRVMVGNGDFIKGGITESGTHADTATTILFTNRLETWMPDPDDPSHIPPYENKPLDNLMDSYRIEDGGQTLVLVEDGIDTYYEKN
jgi:hypothetical protein